MSDGKNQKSESKRKQAIRNSSTRKKGICPICGKHQSDLLLHLTKYDFDALTPEQKRDARRLIKRGAVKLKKKPESPWKAAKLIPYSQNSFVQGGSPGGGKKR